VADVPVKRDAFDPTEISLRASVVAPPAAAAAAAPAVAAAAAAAPAQGEAEAEAQAEAEVPAPEPKQGTLQEYWRSISRWASAIEDDTSPVDDIPEEVLASIAARYVGDEQAREKSWLIMVSWLFDHIHSSQEYSAENKRLYLRGLSHTLLEFIWDESLRPNEQLALVQAGDAFALQAGKEQIVERGGVKAFRFVDSITGVLKYMCGLSACSEAIKREFEANPEDPLQGLVVTTETTGPMYGFIVPKAKERRLIFKTSSPPAPGRKLEKGGECAIISAISHHITILKAVSDMLMAEGYPRFILTDEILDEKARKKKERELAKSTGRKVVSEPKRPGRTFENAVRACALNDIILRWMDVMGKAVEGGAARKRYFYRPVAALKSGHKGAVQKI
jgi:hypothetical protein